MKTKISIYKACIGMVLTATLLIFTIETQAQQQKVDSLRKVLISAEGTEKIATLKFITSLYQKISTDSSIYFGTLLLQEATNLNDTASMAAAYNELGIAYIIRGESDKCLENWEKSLELYTKINKRESMSQLMNNIGVYYKNMSEYEKAMPYYQNSLDISEQIGDKAGQGNANANLGVLFFNLGNNEKALEYYQKGLKIYEELGEKIRIAQSFDNIGVVYKKMGETDKAIFYFEESIKLNEELNNTSGLAVLKGRMAEIYAEQGKFQKALQYSNEALEMHKKAGNVKESANTLKMIGEIYIKSNNFANALIYLKESREIYKRINLRKEEFDALKLISTAYEAMGQPAEALKYYKEFVALKDSTFKEEMFNQIAELETKYETQKKEGEIERLKREQLEKEAEIMKQKFLRNTLAAGGLVLLILAFSTYWRFLVKKKANQVLEEKNIKILTQKEEIEAQRDEIGKKNAILTHQKQAILDSIVYASRIQNAILPPTEYINEILPEHFIYWKPRDVVSGDFYWMTKRDNRTVIVAADCTGHGVPGAFMSMLGVSFLNEIVNKLDILASDTILNELKAQIIKSLHQTGKSNEAKDGMDIALCIFDAASLTLEYSGAYNPLFLIRDNELVQYKANKMPIGIYLRKDAETFTKNVIQLQKDDVFYIFSDGYQDQFGGEKGDKFMTKNFKSLLVDIHKQPVNDQYRILEETMNNWKGNFDQIDDILIIGVKV